MPVNVFILTIIPFLSRPTSPAGAWGWTNVKQVGINFIPRESHLWFVYRMLGLYLPELPGGHPGRAGDALAE